MSGSDEVKHRSLLILMWTESKWLREQTWPFDVRLAFFCPCHLNYGKLDYFHAFANILMLGINFPWTAMR